MMCETQSSVAKVDLLENRLRANWTAIKKARKDTAAKRKELDDLFASRKSPDTSIVVFGSVARQEVTLKSDLDWILLIDGQSVLNTKIKSEKSSGPWPMENLLNLGRGA